MCILCLGGDKRIVGEVVVLLGAKHGEREPNAEDDISELHSGGERMIEERIVNYIMIVKNHNIYMIY